MCVLPPNGLAMWYQADCVLPVFRIGVIILARFARIEGYGKTKHGVGKDLDRKGSLSRYELVCRRMSLESLIYPSVVFLRTNKAFDLLRCSRL
jgi:hypothetical protein